MNSTQTVIEVKASAKNASICNMEIKVRSCTMAGCRMELSMQETCLQFDCISGDL